MPFQSNSFDAVLSLAVLEHVKNPYTCAQELSRVLKPDGLLMVVAPFLQPFHGYPDHYFNMTSSGLLQLFKSEIEVIDCFVPQCGLPIWALSWFLRVYTQGLPPEIARQFQKLTVADLIRDTFSQLNESHVQQLNPAVNRELACTNFLIGKKKTK